MRFLSPLAAGRRFLLLLLFCFFIFFGGVFGTPGFLKWVLKGSQKEKRFFC